jgi:hypothetical protein
MATAFEKNSVDWQLQQVFRRVGEWIELKMPQFQAPNVPDAPQWAFPSWWLEAAFWVIVGAIVIWLSYQLYRLVRPYLDPNHPRYGKLLDRQGSDIDQERSIAAWLRAAQEYQRQGNYRNGCWALYMAMLQRLSDTKLIPAQVSRTDGEYARLVQLLPQAEAYQTLLTTHEQLRFGQTEISVEQFNRCQQAYRTIEGTTT